MILDIKKLIIYVRKYNTFKHWEVGVNIIEDFRNNKPAIIKYVKKNGIDKISMFAACGAVPLYAIWTFIIEEFPEYAEEAVEHKKRLKKFYGYKE